jgi:hypothetical protein
VLLISSTACGGNHCLSRISTYSRMRQAGPLSTEVGSHERSAPNATVPKRARRHPTIGVPQATAVGTTAGGSNRTATSRSPCGSPADAWLVLQRAEHLRVFYSVAGLDS